MNQRFKNDSLGTRMKGYESIPKNFLMRRTPVIIRLDGKAFHTFTKKINTTNDPSLATGPFSEKLHWIMTQTTKALCDNIQNVQFGYTQSDEITLVLKDWQTLTTDQWYGGNVQKMVSVSASIATAYFNHYFAHDFNTLQLSFLDTLAFFDSRVFNIPMEEVNNNLIWRQQDATRNSINMLGQFYFSHKDLHEKNTSQVQDMLMETHGVNWNDLPTWMKRGSSVYKTNKGIIIDDEIPIFTQDRNFIERFIL
jgi:tRNA(His) guanylyltransferase